MQTIDHRDLCQLCFAKIGKKAKACPYCDGIKNTERYPTSLKEGTVLAGRYCIGKILGKGGFGITYLCYDLKDDKKVAVKEYMPDSLAYRNEGSLAVTALGGEKTHRFNEGAKKFFDEAKLVSCFNGNPNIIGVYEFFDENNTTYFVMEYLSGIDMKAYLAKEGRCSEGELVYIIDKVTQALNVVHSINTLHRDISPDNIFLCENGQVKLIDFGAARHVLADESNSLSVIIKHGFAPKEQYYSKGNQGPWTDIYSLGASIYYGLTGQKPDDALSRLDDPTLNLNGVSPEFAPIIEKMMAIDVRDRYQTVLELRNDLEKLSIAPVMPTIKSTQPIQPYENSSIENNNIENSSQSELNLETEEKSKRKKWLIPVIAAAACISLAITLVPIILGFNNSNSDLNENFQTAEVSDEANSSLNQESDLEKEDMVTSSEKSNLSSGEHIHTFTSSKITKQATTTSTGVKTYYCSCGATKTEIIPKLQGVDWKYSNGTLTIFGTGQMENYTYINGEYKSTAPWMEHKNAIKKVVIENGVTSIGDDAFDYCENLTSVTIPSSVKTIGDCAFYGCFSLASANIPKGVASIGEYAFWYCYTLSSINLPDGITTIGEGAFLGCNSLTSINLPNSVITINKWAFADCDRITSVTIPNGITTIGERVFDSCDGIKSVTVSDSVKTIEGYAFSDCKNLKTVTIKNKKGNVTIASTAFSGCSSNIKITYTN